MAALLWNGDAVVTVQRNVGFEFETNWQLRKVESRTALRQWTKEQERAAAAERKRKKQERREQERKAKKHTGTFTISSPTGGRLDTEKGKERDDEGEQSEAEEQEYPAELPEQEAERTLPGADLRKGDRVVLGNGFDLTADTTPGGGAEIEFVTIPFPETQLGRDHLQLAMQIMTRMAARLSAMRAKSSFPITTLKDIGTIGSDFGKVRVFPYGPLTANPQATAGIRLDQLPALIQVMQNEEVEPTVPSDLGSTLLKGDADVVADAAHRAAAACSRLSKKQLKALGDRRGALQGLVTMIVSYLLMGHKKYSYRGVSGPLSISKSIAPIMARTNFAVMFDQVFPTTDDFLAVFAKSRDWVSFVLGAAGLQRGPVFEHGFYRTEVVEGKKREVLQTPDKVGLEREAWLGGMSVGIDLMTKRMMPLVHGSLGSLQRGEKVGPGGDAMGAILELRRMETTVPVERWHRIAIGVFDLITELHSRR